MQHQEQGYPNNVVGDTATKLETANQPHQSSAFRGNREAEWFTSGEGPYTLIWIQAHQESAALAGSAS